MHLYPTIDWQYPSDGPAPPSPIVVNTVPEYFGNPTPPPSPPTARATPAIDRYAPCPPTPPLHPLDAEQDQPDPEQLNATNQSTLSETHDHSLTPEPNHSTPDPPTDETLNNAHNQPQYNDPPVALAYPNPLDRLLHARETYAHPSPILAMIQRATFDMYGFSTVRVNLSFCGEPFKLFSLTGGRTPMTGLYDHDQQSLKYYDKRPHPSPFGLPEFLCSYYYPISTIETLQRLLRINWSLVYPKPIPPVIIRSRDLIGFQALSRRLDGFAFVVPAEDSIWTTVRRRGIDPDYRPINRSLTVETSMIKKGVALYYPQHIVASRFAVNVFLEIPGSATGSDPLCEYLGAYVLQAAGAIPFDNNIWTNPNPEVKQAVHDRVPDCFKAYKHPSLGVPQLQFVQFHYYKWDRNIIGLADEGPDDTITTANQEGEGVDLDDYSDDMDTDSDTDSDTNSDVEQGTATTSSTVSPGQK